MLYMPAANLATPVVLQGVQPVAVSAAVAAPVVVPGVQPVTVPVTATVAAPVTLPTASRYYMLPSAVTTVVPTAPLYTTPAVYYPRYGLVMNPIEKVDTTKVQLQQCAPQVVHRHVTECVVQTCPGCCETCCPCKAESVRCCSQSRSRSRSRSPSPARAAEGRCSRRDEFDRANYDVKLERLDEKIERLRRELNMNCISKQDTSTETVDSYRPPVRPPPPVVLPPINPGSRPTTPRPRSRSRSKKRGSSLPREPWRTTNQNEYPWRDSHLPAYREATLARAQTPVEDTQQWKETTYERSYSSAGCYNPCHTITDYSYRPNATVDYTCQPAACAPAVSCGTTVYDYSRPSSSTSCHGFYSDIPTTTKTHHLKKLDATPSHNLYGCDDACLHVVPKHGDVANPPYMKIHNAPVTYLH